MKKITFIAAVFGMLTFTSCSNETESEETTTEDVFVESVDENVELAVEEAVSDFDASDIVGDWKLSDVDFEMEIPAEQQEMFDAMIKSMVENTTMTFNENGTFVNNSKVMGQEKTETGTYVLNGNKLTSTNADGKQDTVDVTELNSDKLEVSILEDGKRITLVFTK